jgi:hypothetical protein
MPVSSKIDKGRKLAICAVFGEVANADGPELQRLLVEDPDFDPGFSQLLDMTQITKVNIDAGAIRTLAQTSVFSPSARRAFVADDAVVFGFSRMFEMLRETTGGTAVRVFRKRDEAMRWLLENEE